MLTKLKAKKGIKKRERNMSEEGLRNIIGAQVRALRRKAKPKMTQQDLAGRVAAFAITLDRTAIYRIEMGHRAVSDIELAALAKALRVSVAFLFPRKKER